MFRPQYIEILKSAPKLFFHESTSEQRYRTFENCVRREISLRIFRLLVKKNTHPGRISHLDVTSGPGITSGPGRTSHPVISGVCMAIYLSYVCHTGLYGHIWAYMGPNFANHSPVWGQRRGVHRTPSECRPGQVILRPLLFDQFSIGSP